MTLYLAVDTATDLGSVALGEPGRSQAAVSFGERRHAAMLLPSIQHVLQIAGAEYPDLTGIVVADGPGSFTGLRIGFATAQGILRAHDGLALHVVPSLMAAAYGAARYAGGPVAALYDALRGEVFAAVYRFGGGGVATLYPPTLTSVRALADQVTERPQLAVGDGAVVYADEVTAWTGRAPVGPPTGGPHAGALLDLLAIEGAVVAIEDPPAFEPTYGRKAEAQVRWEAHHGRPLPDPAGDPR